MPLKKRMICLWIGVVFGCAATYGQTVDSVAGKMLGFPSKLLGRIQSKTASLDRQLTKQTEKYLQKMAKQEERMRMKLYKTDSTAAKNLFANSAQQYAALVQKLKVDSGNKATLLKGAYLPYADTLRCSMSFLQQNPQISGATTAGPSGIGTKGMSSSATIISGRAALQRSMSELQALQAKLQDADQAQQFVRDREGQIKQYMSRYTSLPAGLTREYEGLNQELYYYAQQVQVYKNMLNNPDKLEKRVMSMLDQLPAFRQFMQNNSQLASLFGTPASYGTAQSIAGLPTRDQVQQLIQGQMTGMGNSMVSDNGGAAGKIGMGDLEQRMASAQSQLDEYKNRLGRLGAGGSDVDMPDFRPNDQKAKTFWKRLEFGLNFQTTKNNYYFPTVTDLGVSMGYTLGHSNSVGIGASYKLGWGSGINHIALSSQGVGMRSYLDIKIKNSFSATGGFEYNYTTPFTSFQQLRQISYWTQSGLIGISKTVSVKSRVFSKTKLQLLWDFLSYQQVPKTQPILFRIGYNF
jgi:hypothetical protein